MNVPFVDEGVQLLPDVVIVKVNGEPAEVVGVPLIVTVLPAKELVTPAGNPETVAPVAPPLNV